MNTADYLNEEIKGLRFLVENQRRELSILGLKNIHLREEVEHYKELCQTIFDPPKSVKIKVEGTIGRTDGNPSDTGDTFGIRIQDL